ncbi:MAG TPA: class F sortase [Geodermatophilus sp.]|nr:class F sortase [Geodermatophilus sp.]
MALVAPAGRPAQAAIPTDVVPGAAAPAEAAAPVRVRVPAVGLDAPLTPVGVDDAGALVVPDDLGTAGWLADGPAPGETGPAVLAGHVDSRSGPAVFAVLDEVAVGDEVQVERGDGTTVRFTVTGVRGVPKDAFPTTAVYGPTPGAELRLITCGGAFDRSRRSYTDNVVVSAVRIG